MPALSCPRRAAIPPDCPQETSAVSGGLWTPVAYLYCHSIRYCGIRIRLIEITKWDECLSILDISRSPKSAGRRIFPAMGRALDYFSLTSWARQHRDQRRTTPFDLKAQSVRGSTRERIEVLPSSTPPLTRQEDWVRHS
jgi:hypothetical protein